MVILNKIYTRTGDSGKTGLANGERRSKFDLRVDSYGTVDETNASIGVARQKMHEFSSIDSELKQIQNDLFDLGADLASPGADTDYTHQPLRVTEAQVVYLEKAIDKINGDLDPLRSFVLPGGNDASAALHMSRTVCRRAERLVVALHHEKNEHVNEAALRYLNRLSDYLFVAARWTNNKGQDDVLWQPGGHLK